MVESWATDNREAIQLQESRPELTEPEENSKVADTHFAWVRRAARV